MKFQFHPGFPHLWSFSVRPSGALLPHRSLSELHLSCLTLVIPTMPPRQSDCWVARDQEDLAHLPELLFHIQHADSQATYSDSEIGIKAADTAFGQLSVSDAGELGDHARNHQDWTNRRPSCFISTFKLSEHARHWGSQRKGPVYMYTINTRLLPQSAGKWVFWSSKSPHEYLFLDQIPRDAIVASEKIRPRTCIKLVTSPFVPGLASQLLILFPTPSPPVSYKL